MKILGIDPGIARTGWGIINSDKNGNCRALSYGCIETSKLKTPETRLLNLFTSISQIVKQHQPRSAAIEQLFFNTNAKTAILVGQARGVAILALVLHKIPIKNYTPLQVKIAITGYGRADKQQIQQMVKVLLDLKSIPQPDDTADALSVALTHAYTKNL